MMRPEFILLYLILAAVVLLAAREALLFYTWVRSLRRFQGRNTTRLQEHRHVFKASNQNTFSTGASSKS